MSERRRPGRLACAQASALTAGRMQTSCSLWERAEAPLYLDGDLRSNHWQVKRSQWLNRE
jgi:hypothetical protein